MNIQISNKWTLSTRSEVRRTAKHQQVREVNYLRRLALFCSFIFFPTLIWYVVHFRLIASNGPFAILYWLHDEFYLWLEGHTWTAIFPYSFMWLFPLLFSIAILLLEYLTPLKITKIIQRFVTVTLLKYETGRKLLKIGLKPNSHLSQFEWENELSTGVEEVKRGAGFLRRVLIELLTKNHLLILNAVEEDNKSARKRIRYFFELANFRIVLGGFGPVFLFGILECLVIQMIRKNEDFILSGILKRSSVQLDKGRKLSRFQTDLATILDCFNELGKDTSNHRTEAIKFVVETNRWLICNDKRSTCELATNFLRAAQLVLVHKLPEGRDLLESWTLCRLGVNCNEVANAERLLHFSFWAIQIEKIASGYKLRGLSAQLWPDSSRLAETGEEFAWYGSLKHG